MITTTSLWIVLGLVIWFGCGFLAAGWYSKDYQGWQSTKKISSVCKCKVVGGVFSFVDYWVSHKLTDYSATYGWKKWW